MLTPQLTQAQVIQLFSSKRVEERLGFAISPDVLAKFLAAQKDVYQITDGTKQYIVRFARDKAHLATLQKEERVQRGLRARVTVLIPDTRVIANLSLADVELETITPIPRGKSICFAIHTLIPGDPLVTGDYTKVSHQARKRLVRDLARFFRQTHDVPLELACEWLDIVTEGDDIAAELAPEYGRPQWFNQAAIAEMRPLLDPIIDGDVRRLFEDTVIRFSRLGAYTDNMVFGHGDLHGYNVALGHDEIGPKLVGVFDLENASILDIHEDFFRLSLVSELMLEQVLAAYQGLGPIRSFDRDRIAIYYRAFLFHLMVGKEGERLEHLKNLLFQHTRYYRFTHGGLPPPSQPKQTYQTGEYE